MNKYDRIKLKGIRNILAMEIERAEEEECKKE